MHRLELIGITKQYPAVRANDAVSLAVRPGSIHAILGENGAGKSTLMKILYGSVRPDAGEIRVDGKAVQISSPAQARKLGISMVYQHFSLFESLTVAENIALGLDSRAPLAQTAARVAEVSQTYGLEVQPERPVHALSVGERQRVEIVRALMGEPRILILDEPTSVLTPQAVEPLFITLRRLAARGCSILYISHKLDEIRQLCDACTVMREGRVVAELDPRRVSTAELSRAMIGAEPEPPQPRATQAGAPLLQLRGLTQAPASMHAVGLENVTLTLHAGEILGIAGVSGNGQQALAAALSGEAGPLPAATLWLGDQDLSRRSPAGRRAAGLHLVPEERLGRGAVPAMSLAQNTLLTREEPVGPLGWLRLGEAHALAARVIEAFGVRASGPEARAGSLSGGNLQKFIVGREIDAQPRVIVVAQPTWGVDVGAAARIHRALAALRDAGGAVLMISDDLDELLAHCDRIAVMARGRLSPVLPRAEAKVERIGLWMSGLWPQGDGVAARTLQEAADVAH